MTTVAYLVDRFPRLSQTFVTNEIAELRRLGFTVPVISLEPGDAVSRPEDDVLVLRDFRPTSLPDRLRTRATRRRDGQVLQTIASEVGGREGGIAAWKLPALARVLRKRGVERIHAHFAWQAAGAAWALAAQLDVPWSMTVHANDIFSRTLHLDAKLAAADRVVTVCQYNADYLRNELGVTRPIDIVVCGVELPTSDTIAAGARAIDVVTVGRLVDKKGIDVFVRAIGHLKDDHPSVSALVIGDGPERAALERLAVDLGVAGNIVFAGAQPHEQTLHAIARAKVFALPARIAASGDRDSMPVVVKEAMARSIPVVATDVVAMPEMVDDEVGRLVPPDDEHAVAKAIGELLDDAELASSLGAAGRARVEERFTLRGEVAKLAAIFEGAA